MNESFCRISDEIFHRRVLVGNVATDDLFCLLCFQHV